MLFAVKAFVNENQCVNAINSRDLEEAYRHIKKVGTIALVTKANDMVAWCELYAITDGEIIPVLTSNDGSDFAINYSSRTIREMNRIRKARGCEPNE